MVALNSVALVMFQEAAEVQDAHHASWALIIIAAAMVLQALAVIAVGIGALVLMKKFSGMADALEHKTSPILAKSHKLLEEIGPKVSAISTNVEQISDTVKSKVEEMATTIDHVNRTVHDINERSRVQISRVDGIVTDALATTYEIQQTVQESVKKPIRQIAGLIAGVRVGIETLIAKSPLGRMQRGPGPHDL